MEHLNQNTHLLPVAKPRTAVLMAKKGSTGASRFIFVLPENPVLFRPQDVCGTTTHLGKGPAARPCATPGHWLVLGIEPIQSQ